MAQLEVPGKAKTSTIDELVNEGIILRSKRGKLSMSKEYRKLVAEISHCGDKNGGVKSLEGVLKDVYLIVLNNPGIKIGQVAEIRGKSKSTVWKQLAALKKIDLIEYRDSDKTGGYYVK
ncbi:MAG: winged helix-turn-helix transcriptional regulator [Bacteroidales bacterium]|nr:winged helix-turn-helix transcriptional regulator [Bacteroidales bacterium]